MGAALCGGCDGGCIMVLCLCRSPNPAWLMGSHSGLGFEGSGGMVRVGHEC